ncbi:Lysozyme G, partial [Merops nubicus]
GVPASERIAERDLRNMEKYCTKIVEVGHSMCVAPALIAGIVSRESHAGAVLENGWGDIKNAFGLMQVDKRYHDTVGSWDSKEHLTKGAEIFRGMLEQMQKKFLDWTKEQQLKAAISAYNAGPSKVQHYDGADAGTTQRDYGNDAVARAKFYSRKGY